MQIWVGWVHRPHSGCGRRQAVYGVAGEAPISLFFIAGAGWGNIAREQKQNKTGIVTLYVAMPAEIL